MGAVTRSRQVAEEKKILVQLQSPKASLHDTVPFQLDFHITHHAQKNLFFLFTSNQKNIGHLR